MKVVKVKNKIGIWKLKCFYLINLNWVFNLLGMIVFLKKKKS